jgi:hypothetical protein
MGWGYSAACFVVSSTRPRAVATRSSNPGFVGPNCRKYSGESPASAPAFRIAMRCALNACTAWIDPKSAIFIAQSRSCGMGWRTSSVASIKGAYRILAIGSYLTSRRFSQRNDAIGFAAHGVNADTKNNAHPSVKNTALLAIVKPDIFYINTPLPIQLHHLRQRNPMFRPVGRIFPFIPVKLHARQSGPRMVNRRLTGASP